MRQGISGTDPDLGCDNCRVPSAAKGVIECSSLDNFTGVGLGRGGDRHLSAVDRMSDADLDAAVGVWGRDGYGRGREPTIVMNVGMHDLTFVADAEMHFAGDDNPNPSLRRSKSGTFDRLLRAVDRTGFGRRVWMTTTATYRADAAAGACPHHTTMVWPTCLQSYQSVLNNERVKRLNEITVATLKRRRRAHVHRWTVLDVFPMTEGREDNLENHDVIHWCGDVKRETANQLMHHLCGCGDRDEEQRLAMADGDSKVDDGGDGGGGGGVGGGVDSDDSSTAPVSSAPTSSDTSAPTSSPSPSL
jgi:hypothetical protein